MVKCRFVTTCVNCDDVPALEEMVDRAKEISYRTFTRYVSPAELAQIFPEYAWHGKGPRMSKDWSVQYYRSIYQGQPAVFVDHSAIEYVWVCGESSGPPRSRFEEELNEIRRRAGLPLRESDAMLWDADISQYNEPGHPDYEAAGPFHGHELPGGYDAPAYRYMVKADKAADPVNGGYSLILRGENVVEINQIASNRKGGGTAMMDFLTELADKMGIILVLRPEAYDVGARQMPQRLLAGWYQRYGFETTGHHNQMARLPE